MLPKEIAVKDALINPELAFHPRYSAKARWYRYSIYNTPVRSVWSPPDAAWIKHPLDITAMQAAAQLFLGQHDFDAFVDERHPRESTRCHVFISGIEKQDDLIFFDVVADRYLYKMVRTLAGTLIEVGEGKRKPEDIPHLLTQKDRGSWGFTAPPGGLSLMAVYFPESGDFFPEDIYVKTLRQRLQESNRNENLLCKAS
jgi:tRNA pseudouridine38-40 synthase